MAAFFPDVGNHLQLGGCQLIENVGLLEKGCDIAHGFLCLGLQLEWKLEFTVPVS
jgi:hypothetical protein